MRKSMMFKMPGQEDGCKKRVVDGATSWSLQPRAGQSSRVENPIVQHAPSCARPIVNNTALSQMSNNFCANRHDQNPCLDHHAHRTNANNRPKIQLISHTSSDFIDPTPDYLSTNLFNTARGLSHNIKHLLIIFFAISIASSTVHHGQAQATLEQANTATISESNPTPSQSESSPQSAATTTTTTTTTAACFGGLQTFEKISMSSFENPASNGESGSFGSGILVQQDDQALTSECINLCRSQSNCLSFVIDYNKFECKSYATTQQELQQEFDIKLQTARSVDNSTSSFNTSNGYQEASASSINLQQLLPSASSNYFEKICLDGVANRNQFSDVCGQGRLWTVERVVDSFLDGYVEKEVTNVNNKDECSKLCIFETQFVCRSADYDQQSRFCRLSKEDRRTQPQAMRSVPGSNRQYLENQCATPGPSSCVYETKKNVGIISMDALKFAQTAQDCQMKCNLETTFNCRSYSFNQQRCFLSGDDSVSLNSHLIKLPVKQGWSFGEKRCHVELCSKGIFTYEKITGYTLRSALTTPIDIMMSSGSSMSVSFLANNMDEIDKLQHETNQTRLRQLLPMLHPDASRDPNSKSNIVSTMMMVAANSNYDQMMDPLQASSSSRSARSSSNLAITDNCRHSCDLGYLNCPAFTIDYKNNRCQRLDRNSQGRHHELVARDGFSYYEKICLRVPEIMSMCQDKYWIFERVIGYELAPRLYEKSLKFVQSRRDCEEYCLEEKQFQCRSALYNDETSDCKLSRLDRRLAMQEGAYYRNFNVRISYLENQCVRDHNIDKMCFYEQTKDEPSYPTYTERIVAAQPVPTNLDSSRASNMTTSQRRFGSSYCEQLCNDNSKFECHSFGYYASTAQCFLSGDDSVSAGELATSPSSGFTYYEKKCRMTTKPSATNITSEDDNSNDGGPRGSVPITTPQNPYLPTPTQTTTPMTDSGPATTYGYGPFVTNNSLNIHIHQQGGAITNRPSTRPSSTPDISMNPAESDPDHYKCGIGHTFVYQRIAGFEPIGGYLTLLIKNNDQPGIVAECADMCKKAYECRAYIVDYASNQCFAMLENSSVGLLSLRQTLGKDYFEGFCVSNHLLLAGSSCRNKTWVMDKIVDQAVIGVQHQKLITDSDRIQCRQACLEERLFWCKSAMFDSSTSECKLYSIERESVPQMRLLFTKGVDFFENQCQITSSSCPYDAIERDMTIMTTTKSVQARSTFDCESACNSELTFNCRSYTYMDQYPGLPNLCILSSDSRSTSQRGSVKEHPRTLYAERNCYYRRPRYPGGIDGTSPVGSFQTGEQSSYLQPPTVGPSMNQLDPYRNFHPGRAGHGLANPSTSTDKYANVNPMHPNKLSEEESPILNPNELSTPIGHGCDPHQYTFERTFGYDFKLAPKERAPIAPTIGIAISCQQECLKRGDRCKSFVVEYALPYQSCFLIESQVGTNKKLLIRSPNSAYFEKVCLPRTGIDLEPLTHAPIMSDIHHQLDPQSMDISPSYSSEPWSPQLPSQLPYHLQQQQYVQNYPSRSCPKLWSFERFVNHNFTAPSDRTIENCSSKTQCESQCINEASFTCRAATYDYGNKVCRLFKNTRRTILSQLVDLDLPMDAASSPQQPATSPTTTHSHPGTAHIIPTETESIQASASGQSSTAVAADSTRRRKAGARQLATTVSSVTAEPLDSTRNIDYMENTCTPEPSSCQYRQVYDQFSPYIDKVAHAVSLNDCQRQCDQERLFSCKSINYDPTTRNCMLINEDLISLNRGQQSSLLPKKNTIYSEKGNCEMISVQCNSQEMLVFINFDAPFRGRIMAKGNPDQCFLIGDGQTSVQFPIIFGPKCNSRQEGHNTFVNEVLIQQHPVIMTDSDKTVRVMCAFEAPDQTITLKNPSSRDNKTGIDVGTPEISRTRHDKQQFNSIVSNKAAPPSVVLRILDQNGRDATMINLGDELILKIQMQMDGNQNSALGIFARNLAAKSSNGESLLLIDNDGCPVDHNVFPALEIDPKDGKSLYSSFKAFRFPSSGLVNFEVQIRFCPEKCQPVDCRKGHNMRSHGRRKRDTAYLGEPLSIRTPIIQSINQQSQEQLPPSLAVSLDAKSTVMPGKSFDYVRKLLLAQNQSMTTDTGDGPPPNNLNSERPIQSDPSMQADIQSSGATTSDTDITSQGQEFDDHRKEPDLTHQAEPNNYPTMEPTALDPQAPLPPQAPSGSGNVEQNLNIDTTSGHLDRNSINPNVLQQSILMHVDEKVVPNSVSSNTRTLSSQHKSAPYGRIPIQDLNQFLQDQPTKPTSEEPPYAKERPQDHLDAYDGNSQPEDTTSGVSKQTNTNTFSQVDPNISESTIVEPINDPINRQLPNDGSNSHSMITTTRPSSSPTNNKDLPLRFSILVGENQPSSNGWAPVDQASVLVMNSTNVDLDHIVIPGKGGQFEDSDPQNHITGNYSPTPTAQRHLTQHSHKAMNGNHKRNVTDESTLQEGSESVIANGSRDVSDLVGSTTNRHIQNDAISESAASHDCQAETARSKLRTIILTGSIVIALNICLVILSLVLYFKKIHLRKNHSIVRSSSDCGTAMSSEGRWPSVLLKSKSSLGTSLNTHEQFFCKLNSKSGRPVRTDQQEFNWPNLSTSSTHSTVSSMASPFPSSSRQPMHRPSLRTAPFDCNASLKSSNFDTMPNHKTILGVNSFERNHHDKFNARFTENIDELNEDHHHDHSRF